MARIKLSLPEKFSFSTQVPVRITDLNYGNHVGNDTILTLIHEARMQYLAAHQLTELSFAGVGLIMGDVAIEFKNELFYGQPLTVWVAATDFSRIGFDIYYKLAVQHEGKEQVVALAKSGMVCYDYTRKKVASVPGEAISRLQQH